MTSEKKNGRGDRQRVSRLWAAAFAAAALAVGAIGGWALRGGTDSPSAAAPTTTAAPTASVPTTEATPTKGPAVKRAVDPCAFVSREEAEQLAGTPLLPAQPAPGSCMYSGPTDGPLAQVEIYVGDGAKKSLDIDRQLGHTFHPVAGLGDEAAAEENAIFFRRGTVWVSIQYVTLRDPAEYTAALETLARVALTRMETL